MLIMISVWLFVGRGSDAGGGGLGAYTVVGLWQGVDVCLRRRVKSERGCDVGLWCLGESNGAPHSMCAGPEG